MVLKGMYNQRSQQQPDVHPTSKELPVTWTTYGLRMGYKPFTDWDAQPSIKWMGYTQPYRILMVHYNRYIYIYRIYIYICVCVCIMGYNINQHMEMCKPVKWCGYDVPLHEKMPPGNKQDPCLIYHTPGTDQSGSACGATNCCLYGPIIHVVLSGKLT